MYMDTVTTQVSNTQECAANPQSFHQTLTF